jgi:hypothetical protein
MTVRTYLCAGGIPSEYEEERREAERLANELDRALGIIGLPPVDRDSEPLAEIVRILTQVIYYVHQKKH